MRHSFRLVLIVAILLVAYIALPLTCGIVLQSTLKDFLQRENPALEDASGMRFSFADYHRGFFESHATLRIEKHMQDGHYETLSQVPVDIFHGPMHFDGGRVHCGLGSISGSDITLGTDWPYRLSFRQFIDFAHMHGHLSLTPT